MSGQESFAFIQGLAVRKPSARLSALLREHDRLLRTVARTRKEIQRTEEDARQTATAVASRVGPVIEEFQRIDAEIHGFFDELLARGKLGKRARTQVSRIYEELQHEGVLSPKGAHQEPLTDWDSDEDPAPPSAGPGDVEPAGGPMLSQAVAGTLRGVFLRLARALHPDRVQDDREKAARTESMKEITRAYEEGDLARLVELERNLEEERGYAGVSGDDQVDRRCEALERTNQGLQEQLMALRRELRALRRSGVGQMADELKRMGRGKERDPIAGLAAEAEADIARFRRLRDFVRAFRDGEIPLREFVQGPPDDDRGDDDDEPFGPGDLMEVISAMAEAAMAEERPPRRGRRRRTRRR
jgi:hypothetical protein